MAASRTTQSQGGNDISTSTKKPTRVESTREQPQQVTRTVSAPSTTSTVQRGATSTTKPRLRVGCTINFSIKINGGLPPITT